jgi:hypothetical protein
MRGATSTSYKGAERHGRFGHLNGRICHVDVTNPPIRSIYYNSSFLLTCFSRYMRHASDRCHSPGSILICLWEAGKRCSSMSLSEASPKAHIARRSLVASSLHWSTKRGCQ